MANHQIPWLKIINDIKNGDEKALELLYEYAVPLITKYLRQENPTLDGSEIEVIVGDIILALWKRRYVFNGESDEEALFWIRVLSRNRAVDYLRIKRKNEEIISDINIENEEDLQSYTLHGWHEDTYEDFLLSLTTREKLVARLLMAGYRDIDIADELSISRVHVNHIKNNIKGKLSLELVEQGSSAVSSYIDGIRKQGGIRRWISKLIIIGEGGVGKTSLLKSLKKEKFRADLSSTHGVEITKLILENPFEKVEMTLNCWDFGGQEIYHSTHQFFLSNNSLFVLVWNSIIGNEQSKLFYWLELITAKAPESPIIIVATHIDERLPELPIVELTNRFPKIVGSYSISNKTGEGIEQILKAISASAAFLPLMGELWPDNWLKAAAKISENKEKFLTENEFFRIFLDFNLPHEDIVTVSRWLHELGEILYYPDDPLLKDFIIVKPQWVASHISKVLESNEVKKSNGVFTKTHMNQLWNDIQFSTREYFLLLMEKFDLSYKTLENNEISLVVERLPLDPPRNLLMWEESKNNHAYREISLKYTLNNIPPGIPTWFIARSHRFSTHTHWRYGALFSESQSNTNLGLIVASPNDKTITLSVRGPYPFNFFALLMDSFENTLRRYPGLSIRRFIPCPGHAGKKCIYEFNYINLINAINRTPPKLTIECHESLEDVSVSELLFGIDMRSTQFEILNKSDSTTILHKLNSIDEKLENQNKELIEYMQREFSKQFFREQKFEDSHCPNVFVLRPIRNYKISTVLGEKLGLQLYCQAPGNWHPTRNGGYYIIDRPSEWLSKMGTYVIYLTKFLRYITPLLGPWVSITASEYAKLIENDLDFMGELSKSLSDLTSQYKDDENEPLKYEQLQSQNEPVELHGAALRVLRHFLDESDKAHYWGGLVKCLTPENHFLWLCEDHAREFTH